MKPDEKQLEELKKYLRGNLKYRETYTEFYDHILAALETKPDHLSFQKTLNGIIKDDFGGMEGMVTIEETYRETIAKTMMKKYRHYMMDYLSMKITSITAILFYIIIIQTRFTYYVFVEMLFVIQLVPGIYKWVRHFKLGYIYGDTKKSVKDNTYFWLNYIPAFAIMLLVILYPPELKSQLEWFKAISPIFITLFLLLTTLHTFAYYKLYKDEFKIKAMAGN